MATPAAGRRRAAATTAVIGLTSVAVTAAGATALWAATVQASGTDTGTVSGTTGDDDLYGPAPVTPGLGTAPHAQSSGS